jgi:3-dehydroquinate synthase
VVVDRSVADTHPCLLDDIGRYADVYRERLALVEGPLVIEGGERCKEREVVAEVQRAFELHGLDRHAFVVIVGGGALQDLVGYAAATTQRGIRVVRVPTTALSQIACAASMHSSINAFGKKDFLAAFAPPFAVINDSEFLRTLPPRETIAGLAMALRGALVSDSSLFGWIRLNAAALRAGDSELASTLVRRAAEQPPRLELGHWVAHRLEAMTHHALSHGEAIAIGSALDAACSAACGLLEHELLEPIVSTIEALGLPTYHPALEHEVNGRRVVLDALDATRELTLVENVGRGVEVAELEPEPVLRAIDWLRERTARV